MLWGEIQLAVRGTRVNRLAKWGLLPVLSAAVLILGLSCNRSAPSPSSPAETQPELPAASAEKTAGGASEEEKATGEALAPAAKDEKPGPIRLHDITARTGITFRHSDGSSGRLYIVETVASGVATFDYDGDGWTDIYFVSGGALPGAAADPPPKNRLYRNLGDFRFVDVTDHAGVGDTGHGLGVAVGDVNNDGCPDLYVSNLGRNVMYLNNGDGTFSDLSSTAGTAIPDEQRVGAGVCFLDKEGDGSLDLFAANYLKWSPDMKIAHAWRGKPIYPGPERFQPYPSRLFGNNGDGTFSDLSEQSRVGLQPGYGMGTICTDYDRDGDTDIFVGNDGGPGNFLFRNDGRGVFEECGVQSGVAYSGSGLAHGSMGADCGDYDNDGLFDLYVTAYQGQLATLYRNRGEKGFEDVSQRIGAGTGSSNQVTWGCGLVDLDNDSRRDIFYVCGHLIDNIDSLDDTTSYLASPVVLWQTTTGRFVNVSSSAGDGLKKKSVGRGAAFDDLDNDGDLDVVILNSRREPTILRNDSSPRNHSLEVILSGTRANRDGVGAVVSVEAGGQRQIAEVHSGRGYQGHFGTRLHFGLGSATDVKRLEVRWLGGKSEILENIPADTWIRVVEGREKASTNGSWAAAGSGEANSATSRGIP